MRNHQIELFYGWEESECGMFHAFFAGDPDSVSQDAETAATRLSNMLDIPPENQNFNWNHMSIYLPDSLIETIKKEGVAEYLCRKEKENS